MEKRNTSKEERRYVMPIAGKEREFIASSNIQWTNFKIRNKRAPMRKPAVDSKKYSKNKYRGGTSDATFRRHSLYIIIIIIIIIIVVVVIVVVVTVVVVNVVGILFIVILVVR